MENASAYPHESNHIDSIYAPPKEYLWKERKQHLPRRQVLRRRMFRTVRLDAEKILIFI